MASAARKQDFQESANPAKQSPFAANDPRYDQGGGHKKKSMTGKLVKGALKMAFSVAAGVAIGYGASLMTDPWFFTPVHDPNNIVARGIENMMNHYFGWVHDAFGLTGEGGFFKSDFVMKTLGFERFIPEVPVEAADKFTEAVSSTDVSSLAPDTSTDEYLDDMSLE